MPDLANSRLAVYAALTEQGSDRADFREVHVADLADMARAAMATRDLLATLKRVLRHVPAGDVVGREMVRAAIYRAEGR